MTKTKNKITGILVALILILISALTLGGLQTKRANAQTETGEYTNKIYYFYDSDPYFKTALENDERDNVVYDGRYMASPQEFKYLLYTGYFWRFTNSTGVAVIIEIKSFELDQQTLSDLFVCLNRQSCGIMLIYPYNDYGYFGNFHCNCPPDAFSEFLKEPFTDYFAENLSVTMNGDTTFLIDGRLVGIDSDSDRNFSSLIFSPVLRRLFNYALFGFNTNATAAFEEGLYEKLWEYYYENYLKDINADCQDYLQIPSINSLVDVWFHESEELGEPYGNMWEDVSNEYYTFFGQIATEYYFTDKNFFNIFDMQNIHLFAHIGENHFVDLLDYNTAHNAEAYYFTDYVLLFTEIEASVNSLTQVYAMSQWYMQSAFYNFILDAQDAIDDGSCEFFVPKLPLYLWCVDPIIWGDNGVRIANYSEKTSPTDEEVEDFFNVLNEMLASIPY